MTTVRPLILLVSLTLLSACNDGVAPGEDSDAVGTTSSASGEPGSGDAGNDDGGGSANASAATAGSGSGDTGSSDGTGDDSGGDATSGATEVSPRTLAIGDSVFEWNIDDGQSIPDFAAQEANLEMVNAAIGGTMILGGKESIPSQYYADGWGRVLIDGGANDVGDGCGCGDCMDVVDQIISEDASAGALVELIDQIRSDGADVILMGYYTIPPGSEFENCDEELAAMDTRYAALAEAREGVTFVSAADVMRWDDNPEYYDDDLVHPAPEGSEAVGRYIGQVINGR